MVVKIKEKSEKTRQEILKITTNLKNIFYEDKEMRDITTKFYQIKRNHII